jgi:PIN domain nuclease of toxin-antitoxin system
LNCVLDASALLALFHGESGAASVEEALEGARVSTVNWAEVVQKSVARAVVTTSMREELAGTGVIFEPFTAQQAETTGTLWLKTRRWGLSLGDRACLALALEKSLPVITADRVWTKLDLSLEIQVIR